MTAPVLAAQVLGPVEVRRDGEPVRLAGAKQRAVLAMLLLDANRVVPIERLRRGVWGDDAPEKTTSVLQVYVSQLRKLLGAETIVSRAPGYLLAIAPESVDLSRFEALTARARKLMVDDRPEEARALLHQACSLWTGPPLADLAYEPFAAAEVDRLEQLRLAAIEDRAECDLAAGESHELVVELEQLVTEHPLRERLWAHLMVALYRSGRQADALRAYGRARRTLVDEYGIDPGPALRELERAVLTQDAALDVPASGATDRPRVRLPAPPNPLLGRAGDLASLTDLVHDPAVRLVTLIGPGGTGKTRLGLALALSLVDEVDGTVAFVRLAEVTDPGRVLAALAAELDVREVPDEPLVTTLAAALGDRRSLLVLDNLEQLVGGAADVARLLEAAPGLTVVATSRAALRLSGEHEYPVEPLELPDLDRLPSPTSLQSVAAVELFVARARAVRPAFALDAANAAAVAEICVRIDGLPLAIELAAARLKMLTPQAILERLGSRLDLLTGGGRDLPDRHRTLRATIDWSHGLLGAQAQRLFAQLGLFAGGFTLDAAEDVCAGAVDDGDILDALALLVDNSLVRPVGGGLDLRFRLLETVRDYAVERLHATTTTPQLEDLRRRHAEHVVATTERAGQALDGPDAPLLLDRLESDHANVRAALRWARHAAPELAARIVVALRLYWPAAGRLTEGREEVATIGTLSLPDELAVAVEVTAATLAYHQSDWPEAERRLTAALAGAWRVHDQDAAARCLAMLAGVAVVTGHPDRCGDLAAQSLELARSGGSYEPHVLALSASAMSAAVNGDLALEKQLYEERLALVRARGDRRRVADTLTTLAEIALDNGDTARARLWGEEALALVRTMTKPETRDALITLAGVALAGRDAERAQELGHQAAQLAAAVGQTFRLAAAVRVVAAAAALQGAAERAVLLFAGADAVHAPAGTDVTTDRDVLGHLDEARSALGETHAAAAWDVGSAMPLERLLKVVLEDARP